MNSLEIGYFINVSKICILIIKVYTQYTFLVINLERAGYEAPNFIRKIERTRQALLDDTIEQIRKLLDYRMSYGSPVLMSTLNLFKP